jgi:hypothetical protein
MVPLHIIEYQTSIETGSRGKGELQESIAQSDIRYLKVTIDHASISAPEGEINRNASLKLKNVKGRFTRL